MLKEAQDYAERLLQPKFDRKAAKAIASDMVTKYPTHEFVIDYAEAKSIGVVVDPETQREKRPIGLQVTTPPNDEARRELDWLRNHMDDITAFGCLVDLNEQGG